MICVQVVISPYVIGLVSVLTHLTPLLRPNQKVQSEDKASTYRFRTSKQGQKNVFARLGLFHRLFLSIHNPATKEQDKNEHPPVPADNE